MVVNRRLAAAFILMPPFVSPAAAASAAVAITISAGFFLLLLLLRLRLRLRLVERLLLSVILPLPYLAGAGSVERIPRCGFRNQRHHPE